jgi:hypothetical protein
MIVELEVHEENQALLMQFCKELEELSKKYNYQVVYSENKYIDIIEIGNNKNYDLFTLLEA